MQSAINNKNMLIVLVSGIVVITVLVFSIFSYQFFFGKDFLFNSVNRNISTDFSIDSQWKEIPMDPPLKVQRQSQKVLIKLPGVKDWDPNKHILLKDDGTRIKIEAVLVDQNGEYTELYPGSIGASIGFDMGPENYSFFDKNKTFKTLRLRSDTPMKAESIDWYCWTGK